MKKTMDRAACLRWVVLGIGSTLLVACNEKGNGKAPPAPTPPAATAVPGAPPAQDNAARANAKARGEYVRAYNDLIDDNRSVAARYKSYLRMGVGGKLPNSSAFYGSPSDLRPILDELKSARAAGSGDAALDTAVDGVMAAGEKLVAVWTPLDPYYASKGFLEDKWVRARGADEDMRGAFTGLLAQIDKLGSELDRVQTQQRAERMAKLKEKGDMVGYHMLGSMALAKKFVNSLDGIDGLKNREAVARTDALAAELQSALADYAKAIADAKAKDGKAPHYGYAGLHDKLQSMIGQWRVFKDSKSSMTFGNISSYYNDAVSTYNSGFGS